MKPREAELIRQMYEHYNYKCFVCPKRATQRSHIIGNTDPNRLKYGKDIIDNILNWLPACNIEHNALIDLGKNDHILDKVWYILSSELPNKRELIEDIVRQNIKRKKEKIDER